MVHLGRRPRHAGRQPSATRRSVVVPALLSTGAARVFLPDPRYPTSTVPSQAEMDKKRRTSLDHAIDAANAAMESDKRNMEFPYLRELLDKRGSVLPDHMSAVIALMPSIPVSDVNARLALVRALRRTVEAEPARAFTLLLVGCVPELKLWLEAGDGQLETTGGVFLEILHLLQCLPMTFVCLQETGIGRAVAALQQVATTRDTGIGSACQVVTSVAIVAKELLDLWSRFRTSSSTGLYGRPSRAAAVDEAPSGRQCPRKVETTVLHRRLLSVPSPSRPSRSTIGSSTSSRPPSQPATDTLSKPSFASFSARLLVSQCMDDAAVEAAPGIGSTPEDGVETNDIRKTENSGDSDEVEGDFRAFEERTKAVTKCHVEVKKAEKAKRKAAKALKRALSATAAAAAIVSNENPFIVDSDDSAAPVNTSGESEMATGTDVDEDVDAHENHAVSTVALELSMRDGRGSEYDVDVRTRTNPLISEPSLAAAGGTCSAPEAKVLHQRLLCVPSPSRASRSRIGSNTCSRPPSQLATDTLSKPSLAAVGGTCSASKIWFSAGPRSPSQLATDTLSKPSLALVGGTCSVSEANVVATTSGCLESHIPAMVQAPSPPTPIYSAEHSDFGIMNSTIEIARQAAIAAAHEMTVSPPSPRLLEDPYDADLEATLLAISELGQILDEQEEPGVSTGRQYKEETLDDCSPVQRRQRSRSRSARRSKWSARLLSGKLRCR